MNKLLRGALIGGGAFLLAAALSLIGTFEGFESRVYDTLSRAMAAPGKATDRVALVLLDQESYDWAEEVNGIGWPWPRELYGYIVEFINRGNPLSVTFDVLFTEESIYGPYDDTAFASAIRNSGPFVGAMVSGGADARTAGTATGWPEWAPDPDIRIDGILRGQVDTSSATFPIEEVGVSARLLANVQNPAHADGVYRSVRPFWRFDGRVVPSLAMAAYIAGKQDPPEIRAGRRHITVDGTRIPLDGAGMAVLRYRGPSATHPAYRAAALLRSEIQILSGEEPEIDPSVFQGSSVFFGFSAPGLKDIRPSPTDPGFAGVEIHATMLDNFLSGDFISVPGTAAVLLMVFAAALGAGISVSAAARTASHILVYTIAVVVPVAAAAGGYAAGAWIPLITLEAAAVMALAGGTVANYATEGRQKRFIRNAFQQYLSPTVIDQLVADPDRLKLGGERRNLTMFFSDLQGFTSISELLTPEDLTALLNDYLSAMTEIIQEEEGTIDKYEGDAIIAFWNAPVRQEDHPVRGVRAALRCQAELARLRPIFEDRVGKTLRMRIGMNTGPAVVGNMGSKTRFDYTMLGDAVNLAARLEGVNKQFGTYTMISESLKEAMQGAFPVRELSRVTVVGRAEPVRVFEPFLPEDFAARKELLETFDAGLRAYYRGDINRAEVLFLSVAADDPPSAAYARKCAALGGEKPKDWHGVWDVTEK